MRVDRRFGPPVRALGFAAAAVVVAGCFGGTGTLDGALPVVLRVSTTTTAVEVDAPAWIADVSEVYLCASAPPPLPDGTRERLGWAPGGDCHDYGRYPSRDGLTVSLPLADLTGPNKPAFERAQDWYVLVLDLDGELVSSAVRSRFRAPHVVTPS
jgi:hypothetical protein